MKKINIKKISITLVFVITSNLLFAQWGTNGNLLTGNEFIGSTNNIGLSFKINSSEKMKLSTTGQLSIGNNTLGVLNIGVSTSVNTKIAAKSGWGDWMQFQCSVNSNRRWSIHNPQNEDAMTFYYVDDNGNSHFNYFTLNNEGKVSIGDVSTSPAGYRLYVKEGILTEKVKVAISTTSDWSDYVFNKDYKMMPLKQLEKYIQANKHLPEVPSAQEVVDGGLDLAKMDARLLQKIEELTLYTIELNKQLEAMKEKLSLLETQK